jgi:hypothetical protein
MQITWVKKDELTLTATQQMLAAETLVDIGCGIVPQNYITPEVHICCEPYEEYVNLLKEKLSKIQYPDRSYILLNMGWQEVIRYFPKKSVDTVMLIDVIEHLEKEDGLLLLKATEKIARKQIIAFTPLGYMPQYHANGKDAWGLSGADWQEHRSGWIPEDFIGNNWQFFISKDFHTEDNLLRPLDEPFGAFWAIKTFNDYAQIPVKSRQMALQNLEVKFKKEQLNLQQRESEINGLVLARFERKLRRLFSKYSMPIFKK